MALPDVACGGNRFMEPTLDLRISRNLARVTSLCCALATGFGLLVLTGWIFHIQRLKSNLQVKLGLNSDWTVIAILTVGAAILGSVAAWTASLIDGSNEKRRKAEES